MLFAHHLYGNEIQSIFMEEQENDNSFKFYHRSQICQGENLFSRCRIMYLNESKQYGFYRKSSRNSPL